MKRKQRPQSVEYITTKRPRIQQHSRRHRSLSEQQVHDNDRKLHRTLPSPQSVHLERGRKRRREESYETLTAQKRPCNPVTYTENKPRSSAADLTKYWTENGYSWSQELENTAFMDDGEPNDYGKRRRSRSYSWRQSTASGNTPQNWNPKHEEEMLHAGIHMYEPGGMTMMEEDKRLCDRLVRTAYPIPTGWKWARDNMLQILRDVAARNEQRVVRDVSPLVLPSPEMLYAEGRADLEYIAESLNAEWARCTPLCGPKPRPDAAHGHSRFVFTPMEQERLNFRNVCAAEKSYFPFLIGEVKSSDRSIEEGERQALHNASVACNTIIELYQRKDKVHRRVLAFSMVHNHHIVKIFAHYASTTSKKPTFYRHRIFETDLAETESDWTRPYQITLALWEHFAPRHLTFVRDALAHLPIHSTQSFTAQPDVADDLNHPNTPAGSKEDGRSKRPSLSSTIILKEENEKLRAEYLSMVESQREAIQRLTEQMQRQLDLQKEEARHTREQLERQLDLQKEEIKRKDDQLTEIIGLLKASK